MTFRDFYDRCIAAGLTDMEAREQVTKAHKTGFTSDDPYLLVFVTEGILTRSARTLTQASVALGEAQGEYPGLVADKVALTLSPLLAQAARSAAEETVMSWRFQGKRILETTVLVLMAVLVGFSAGLLTNLFPSFWHSMEFSVDASRWAELIRLNPELPGAFENCLAAVDPHGSYPRGLSCKLDVAVLRAQSFVSALPAYANNSWLAHFLLGSAFTGLGVLAFHGARRLTARLTGRSGVAT